MDDKILTIKQASEFLKLHISTINRLIEAGEIPSYKLGKRRLFDRGELYRWFKSHKNHTPKAVTGKGQNKKQGGAYGERQRKSGKGVQEV